MQTPAWLIASIACFLCVGADYTPNAHLANSSTPYTKNLEFLLQQYTRGYGMPTSYKDELPDGRSYWGTKTYLDVGAFEPTGSGTYRKVTLDSQVGIQERTLTHSALNLYDGATWEIALALWGRWDVAFTYERSILYPSTTGDGGTKYGNPGGLINIRADSATFQYGEDKVVGAALLQVPTPGNLTRFLQGPDGQPLDAPVERAPGALYYRIVSPDFGMRDPLTGPYGHSWKFPWPDPGQSFENKYGVVHHNDWKPIVGENVWAAILGPLQTLYISTGGNLTNATCGNAFLAQPVPCDFKTWDNTPPPVQLAISILPALEALQSYTGALYHAPWGSQLFPEDPDEGQSISNENNASAYAALKMLLDVLQEYAKDSADEFLQYGLRICEQLVKGLKYFFSTTLLSEKGEIPDYQLAIQGGHITSDGYRKVKLNESGGIAVDCQTWLMTVIGAKQMDEWYGNDTSYNIWQGTKKYAGYFTKDGKLGGVGYTAEVVDGTVQPKNDVWSAEWTFGAINMAQVLAGQYKEMGNIDHYNSLMEDAQSMWNEVSKPWPMGLQMSDGAYVYANQRFFIPWGWYANPIGALCSTAWAVMQERNFNPFELGGGDKPALTVPEWLNQRQTEPTYIP